MHLHRFAVTDFTLPTLSCNGLLLFPSFQKSTMLSNQSFHAGQAQPSSWLKSLQTKIQGWIRQEIIDEDPCDEEKFAAQRLYDQFQALEKASQLQRCPMPQRSASY
jgi:hypothetical protein